MGMVLRERISVPMAGITQAVLEKIHDTWRKTELLRHWPRGKCSVFNACGNFGSYNSNNRPLLCKRLPGFKPQYLQQWNSEDFSGGCIRDSALCGNNKNDTFLSLKKMKVGNPHSQINVESEMQE
ncbi:hypothetical protein ACFX12_018827 [Malus domestica]